MDNTEQQQQQQQKRYTTNSIAEQELFFPSDSESHRQDEYHGRQQLSQRWSSDLTDEPPSAQPASGVPVVNIIPATPTTIRSNSVRSNFSYRNPNDQKQMAGALTEVEEEDNIYDPPSESESFTAPPESNVTFHEMPSSSELPSSSYTEHQPESDHISKVTPLPEPALPHYDPGHQYSQPSVPSPAKDAKGKSPQSPTDVEEQPPPLPGPRPSNPEVADYYAQAYASEVDPAVQEQEDRDYAMALAMQEEEESQAPRLPQHPAKSSSGWDTRGPPSSDPNSTEHQDRVLAMRLQEEEEAARQAPPLPTRPDPDVVAAMLGQQEEPEMEPFARTPSTEGFLPPPKRQGSDFGADDPSNPIHYTRDPHKLIAYLVPFPKPWLGPKAPVDAVPTRFLIYTPPPPPLQAPPEGVKEGITHKVQRKWQSEVRQAKMSEAKTTSWAGFKAKTTRGIDKAMQYTTTSNLDFLSRVTPPSSTSSSPSIGSKLSIKGIGKKSKTAEGKDEEGKGKGKGKEPADDQKYATEGGNAVDGNGEAKGANKKAVEAGLEGKSKEEIPPAEGGSSEERLREEKGERPSGESEEKESLDVIQDDDPARGSHETKKTVGVEEIVFVYPPSINMSPEGMRAEFINTILRTKSKAQRDAIIATGLLPISLAIDILMIAVSGLFEVNAVWAYFTIKGTKTARSITKRLASSSEKPETIDPEKPEHEMDKEDKLQLIFKPAPRIDVLARYLQAECHRVDSRHFPKYISAPTEYDCLEAIGWSPAQTRGQQNWEDEAWEMNDVKEDLRVVMHKAAKEWRTWCNKYEKNPEKNSNK